MAGKANRQGGGLDDAGFAILEFGRAFPNEAIRSLHSTLDGKAVFIRLYDNKAGIMRSHSRHFSCHLIKRSEEHTSELQSLMRISYAVFCLKKKQNTTTK